MPEGKDGGMQEDGGEFEEAKVKELCHRSSVLGKFGEDQKRPD
jgi:hypothetical protein